MAQENPLIRYIRNRFWFVQPTVTLLSQGAPDEAVERLARGAKPSRERLHLQELFTDGRRYIVEPRKHGFVMLTNSKHYWRYTEGIVAIRRRTRSAAKLIANLTEIGGEYTRIELKTHIRLGYFLDIFWIPVFIATIVIGMPWQWWFIAAVISVIFTMSFAYHFYNAAFQANEMIFFVEKVLKDQLVTNLPTLPTENPDLLRVNKDFEEEWERFYSAHQPKD